MRIRARTLLLSVLLTVACAAAAGTVEVSFVNPASYIDAGRAPWDKDANLQVLQRHLQSLGQRLLPANQVLKIELLDVDLAGDLQPRIRGEDVRVLRGKADFPRIHLKYTLEADGVAHGSGTEWVTDLNYARGGLSTRHDADTLYYEKRMLDAWFKARFVDARGGG